jgi:hypothetical protein
MSALRRRGDDAEHCEGGSSGNAGFMSISEPKPKPFVPEPDREPRRDNAPPFPTKFGHQRRRAQPQPPPQGANRARPAAPDKDPFEDDGGL